MKHTAEQKPFGLFAQPTKFAGIRDAMNVNGVPRVVENVVPLARNSDPATSHEAAREVRESGQGDRGICRVTTGVRDFPGKTSRELAALIGMDRHECARRLSDAEQAGLVRKGPARTCKLGNRSAHVWEVA